MLRRRFSTKTSVIITYAIITYVIITVLCGCTSVYDTNDELSELIRAYLRERQAQEIETKIQEEIQDEEGQGEKEERLIGTPEIYYAYNSIDADEKKLYLEILDALENMSDGVDVSTLDSGQLDKIFECVMRDHPELFYVDGFKYTEHFLDDALIKVSFRGIYSATKEEAESVALEIEKKLAECMSGAAFNEDEYKTVKYLYDYLIDNTEYDKNAENNQNIRSVFLGKRSVCQGYAKAMQYMLQKAGIQSFLVTGYTGSERHAWNLARVNGNYYYLDPTWGDASYSYSGSKGVKEGTFCPPINYDYFLVTTDEISKTHSFEFFLELPECDSVDDNYYVREGLFFESYDIGQLENILKSDAVKTADYVTLKCVDRQVYEDMLSAVIGERRIFGIIDGNEHSISYASNDELCTISFWDIY